MTDHRINKLDASLSDSSRKKVSSDDEDDELLRMARILKASSGTVNPTKQFSERLQTRMIQTLKAQQGQKEKKSMNNVNWKIVFGFGASALVLVLVAFGVLQIPGTPSNTNGGVAIVQTELPRFASCSSLTSVLKENYQKGYDLRGEGVFGLGLAPTMMKESSLGTTQAPSDYSQTNIQVAGVDEADIVKTDGKYIYTVSGSKIFISQAYPPSEAKLLSKIEMENSTPTEIFIDGENLLIFGTRYASVIQKESPSIQIYPAPSQNLTFVEIYSLDNPEKPELKRKLEFEGSYSSSRKIDNYVYFVVNSWPDYQILEGQKDGQEPVPLYRDLSGRDLSKASVDFQGITRCADVSYIEPIASSQYVSVIGLPIDDYDKPFTKEVIVGSSENIYSSLENLYIANTTWQYSEPGILEKVFGATSSEEKTNVYKFSLAKDQIKFQGQTSVPGTILNQFSMDEHKDHFRIATTIGYVTQQGGNSTNNVYILDKDLKLVGSLEDIAPGEKFYSTRFMGDRAYLVTFKKVDPFFTVDLSDPTNPKILGKLKIPGYSDYLHPYDEDHIIGIGKETEEAEEGNFAWYQGMKMAIFDVTDVANPTELHKIVIGDRGTDSPILTDHKAFLFSKDKNLLVIPVTLAQLTAEQKANTNTAANTYGEFVFQGSYVYNISLDKGFELKGRVTHFPDDEVFQKSGYYFGEQDLSIKRNLYIDDSLYSISNGKIMINALADLTKQGEIGLE